MSRTALRVAAVLVLISHSASAADDLWKEPQDTVAALTQSHLYAWKLFVALNWPADTAQRTADPKQTFGENLTTVWESWKLSSGTNDEVFLRGGVDPGPWLPGRERIDRAKDFEPLPLQQRERLRTGRTRSGDLRFDPASGGQGNENHMNKDAYEFIRKHELYHVEGQEALFEKAEQVYFDAETKSQPVDFAAIRLDFPLNAKETKAQWRLIAEADKPRYRWVEIADASGGKRIFGLTALHITTKDLPNWLWATFEHVDNPKRPGAEPWILPSRDRAAGPNGYPPNLGIEGTRWENYRLRGVQIEFTDPKGEPTMLANSQIESGFQTTSSCITCHARAAIGAKTMVSANRLSIFHHEYPATQNVIGNVGVLDPALFVDPTFTNPTAGELRYLPLDFVWSLMRAKRKSTELTRATPTFTADIKPLFRVRDINAMRGRFDLSKYEDVKRHAKAIYDRLEDGSMPCDGPWPEEQVVIFKKWMDTGMPE